MTRCCRPRARGSAALCFAVLAVASPAVGEPPEPAAAAQRPEPARRLDIGPHLGLAARRAKGDGIRYDPSFAWGAHVRLELASFLGLRLSWKSARHAVSVKDGALGLPGADDPPPIDLYTLGARLEPTLALGSRARLFAGVGVAWGRASEAGWSVAHTLIPERTGVMLELPEFALGASFELVPHWLDAGAVGSAAAVGNESGELFEARPVVGPSGSRASVAALPEVSSAYSGMLWVSLVR